MARNKRTELSELRTTGCKQTDNTARLTAAAQGTDTVPCAVSMTAVEAAVATPLPALVMARI